MASRGTGSWNRGYPRPEGVLQAALQHCQPHLNEPVGAAPALSARGLALGRAPVGEAGLPLDSAPAVEMRQPEAVTLRISFRARAGGALLRACGPGWGANLGICGHRKPQRRKSVNTEARQDRTRRRF